MDSEFKASLGYTVRIYFKKQISKMYTKIHSSEKSGHDFEKEQGGVYGRIRRKEGKGKMI